MFQSKKILPSFFMFFFVTSTLTYDMVGQCTSNCSGTNSFLGTNAGRDNTSGGENSFYGRFAGVLNTTGDDNSFFGSSAGFANTTGNDNSFFGRGAGFANTTARDNSFFGSDAGLLNTTGNNNSFFGSDAGRDNTSGEGNSFFGQDSGRDNTGSNNSFFGRRAGFNNISANNNSFYGSDAGRNNTIGVDNSFFGSDAGLLNTSGNDNSFFGERAGSNTVSGSNNSFFGRDAGLNNITGHNNSFFGTDAGGAITGSNNVIIGKGAGPTFANASISDRLYIDFVNSLDGNDNPLIYGEFDNDFVRINGTFEVTAGLTNPSSIKLKDRFATVAPMLVLDKINQLDISEWSYKSDPDVRHIGPTAESFYEAFGLGTGGDNISTIDADGVSLIAIQALTQEIADQQEQLTKKDQEIKNLEERLLRIEKLLSSDKEE